MDRYGFHVLHILNVLAGHNPHVFRYFVTTPLNPFTILYTVVGTLHLLVDFNGLHLTGLFWTICIDIAIYMLCLGLVWVHFKCLAV